MDVRPQSRRALRWPAGRPLGRAALGGPGHAVAYEDEFQRFAEAFLPTLLKGAYLLMHDIDLAEDAVQGTLLRVFKQWPEARRSPEAYSRVTLANLCRDHWRRLRSRPTEVLSDDFGTGAPHPSAGFSDAWAERKMLDQALESLGSPQRDVLVLRFFLELSVSETAAALGIPEGTVKSATSRGLAQLRGLLVAAEGGDAR